MGDISRNGATISEEGEDEAIVDEDVEEDPSSSLSHPSSPSPPNASTMLLTPASADLFRRVMSNGSDNGAVPRLAGSSSNGGSSSDLSSLNGIKVISDGERGNVYYTDNGDATLKFNGKALRVPAPLMEATNGDVEHGANGEGEEEGNGEDKEYTPMFASLAHTPAQLAEFKRMREDALKNKRPRAASRSTSANDVGVNGRIPDEMDGIYGKEANGIHGQ